MFSSSLQSGIQQKLQTLYPALHQEVTYASVGGGSINQTYQLTFGGHQLFCKINSATKFPHLFQKESEGLNAIKKHGMIKVPNVIDCFEVEGCQVLLLEWIEPGERTECFWKKFGEQVAALHQVSNNYFGWKEDNYMGSIPQSNRPSTNWINFFIQQRLQPLLIKSADRKLLSSRHQQQFERLYLRLPNIFDSQQKPSLLHGDLWSGNFMCNNAEPVLIDPAVYYGHPSVDLGMTTLFGGFRSPFYEAYHYHFALPANCEEQWEVCNLYPLLIHLLLFGNSYLAQIERTLHRF